MTPRKRPRHSLEVIQAAVQRGDFTVTRTALETASAIYCDRDDIQSCVLGLSDADFYKAMRAKKKWGLWQDVYKTHYRSWPVYLKLQLTKRGTGVVISFKLDEDP